jgi:DNA-binding response OmpR family regulator
MMIHGNMIRLAPGVRFDPSIHGVWRHQQCVPLSDVPYRILSYLCQHPRRLVSIETLLQIGWDHPAQRTAADIYRVIHQLRQVIESDPDQPRLLISERSLGYILLIASHQTPPSYRVQ